MLHPVDGVILERSLRVKYEKITNNISVGVLGEVGCASRLLVLVFEITCLKVGVTVKIFFLTFVNWSLEFTVITSDV